MRLMIAMAVFGMSINCCDVAGQPVPEVLENSIGLKLVRIPGGDFEMGSEDGPGDSDEQPKHLVRITKDFLIGQTEVTHAQWRRVMNGPRFRQAVDDPFARSFVRDTFCKRPFVRYREVVHEAPGFWKDDDHPVDRIAWDDAMTFCTELSAMPEERQAGRVYRLPTEAEWEYACRAGSQSPFSFEGGVSVLGEYAWFFGNAGNSTHAVGQKKPNAWGLYDMHGNVWEWCGDWYDERLYSTRRPAEGAKDPAKDAQDPKGPLRNEPFRVVRGGSWYDNPDVCRSANRFKGPSVRFASIGFRVVVEVK